MYVYNSAVAFLFVYFFNHNWDSMQFCEDIPWVILSFSHHLIPKQTCYNQQHKLEDVKLEIKLGYWADLQDGQEYR